MEKTDKTLAEMQATREFACVALAKPYQLGLR